MFSSGEEEQFLSKQWAHIVANYQIGNWRRKEKPLNIWSGIIWHSQVIMSLSLPFTYSFVQLLSFVGYICKGDAHVPEAFPAPQRRNAGWSGPWQSLLGFPEGDWCCCVKQCLAVGAVWAPHGALWSCWHYTYWCVYKHVCMWEAKALFSLKYCFA